MTVARQLLVARAGDDSEGWVSAPDLELWRGVDRLLDRARAPDDVRVHRLELLALARWRATGRDVPLDFRQLERRTMAAALAMPILLERIREIVDGRLLVMKGPEIAARYPGPALRAYSDVDLVVEEPERAQRALLAAGFELIGDERIYRGIHHLRPLYLAGMPVVVELHERPKWVEGVPAPSGRELLDAGVPAAGRVEGLLAPPPAQHALILAAHSWAHQPLRRLGDLVDVAAAAQGASSQELARVAAAWRLERVWATTEAAIRGVLFDGPATWPLRTWARNLRLVRDRSVLEFHLERWLSAFSAFPPGTATARAARAVLVDLRPESDEDWSAKRKRARTAMKNAFVGKSRHEEELRRSREEGEDA